MKRKTIKLCLELTIATEKWWILFAYRSPNTHKEEFFDEISVSFNKILGRYHNVILAGDFNIFELTLSWWRPLSYRNQSIDLRSLRHERVKEIIIWEKLIVPLFLFAFWKAQACYGKHYPQTIFFNAWYPPEGHTYLNKRTFQRKV